MKKDYYGFVSPDITSRLWGVLDKKMMDQNINPQTRAAIRQILRPEVREIETEFNKAVEEEIKQINDTKDALNDAEVIIKRGEKFPSRQACEAMTLYHEIVDREHDEQSRRNAILAAGQIVSAFLETYFGRQ